MQAGGGSAAGPLPTAEHRWESWGNTVLGGGGRSQRASGLHWKMGGRLEAEVLSVNDLNK